MIPVTKPFLTPLPDFEVYMRGIWQRNWFTNNGPLVNELELRLKEFLNLNHVLYLTNGTIALQFAFRALQLNSGEVITTPFSYIATTSAIVWEGCTPVFADIDEDTLNIDPSKIAALVTEKTVAIVATHTYGNPCNIEAIQAVADQYRLKVIYDGAHCFGTTYKGKSVFAFGDISTASFHATKMFHTVEGGAVFTKDPDLLKKMAFMRNFGHNGPDNFEEVGINGKNSELHAAIGLVNLKYFDEVIQNRKKQSQHYDTWMKHIKIRKILIAPEANFNFSYYPVIFETESALLKAVELLNAHLVYPRRYFYPALNKLKYVDKFAVPVCDDVSPRVLCLPLYHDLSSEEIDYICRLILRAQNN